MQKDVLPSRTDIDGCLIKDRRLLHRRRSELERELAGGSRPEERLAALVAAVHESRALALQRMESLPVPSFPPELPISERRERIEALIRDHQVLILCGETGSGKSTQLPKICLALGRGVFGRIGHTQPRRIAARSLAARISEELQRPPGTSVGYKVRFHDHVRPESHVKLMTDGILLAEIQKDRFLNEYDTLIIDEAHERSLNIDFLLGYLKRVLPKRPDLKLIITSATIDPERFSKHFSDAPIVNVSGRTYPVEVRYRPVDEGDAGERDEPMQQAVVNAVDELTRVDRGDILVFLSGEREIRETAESLRKHRLPLTEILPLYARLGPGEQGRIFKPSGLRRIILATNVAETSLTVPGIRYVIDTGFARISRYSHRSKVQRLPVERISQASADQRKGRCGRVAAGICIRLYAEEDFQSRQPFTEPEILRTNLASVILQMTILGFGEIASFPFVDAPDSRLIKDGYRVLEEIGAVDGQRRVTRLGRQLARLPVDPRVGRMLLAAADQHCLEEVLIIASALSIQDPRDRPLERREAADEAHYPFRDDASDFMGLIKLWRHLDEHRRHLSKRKFRNHCRDHYLSWTRVQEWYDIHHQLRGQLHEMGYRENRVEAGYEEVHKALLSGLLGNIGFKGGGREKEYLGARNTRFRIFPGSGLFAKQPKWVLAAELVETTRLYGRTVASIQPGWVESVAGHLVKRSYSEPHWEKGRGQVAAYEKVNLFGLTLVARRKVNFGPIEPAVAREIFIRSALTEGDFDTRAPFWRHNRELIADIDDLERKTRRRDLLVDEETIYAYYDKRVPEGIYSTPQFEKWLKGVTRKTPKLLHMRIEDLLRQAPLEATDRQYPDYLDVEGTQLPLQYCFHPGEADDGVTLRVPQAILNQVTEARCGWLVPGLLREKVIALIRGLPKAIRKSLVPVPDVADACMAHLTPSDTPLTTALGEQLKRLKAVYVPEDAWDEGGLPGYLRMNVRVVDERGKRIGEGKDLAQLRRRFGGSGERTYHAFSGVSLERKGLRDWEFDTLPETVELDRGGIRLQGFPALVDEGESVSLRILDARTNAEPINRQGVRRLIMFRLAREVRYLRRNLPGLEQMKLQYATVAEPPAGLDPAGKGDLENDLVALIIDMTFLEGRPRIGDRETFDRRLEAHRGEMMNRSLEILPLVREVMSLHHGLRKRLRKASQVNWLTSVNDIGGQLERLVYRGFILDTPWEKLAQFPRYLRAIGLRIDKLETALARDRQRMEEMSGQFLRWRQRDESLRESGRKDPRVDEIRWMLEELRVSLFAQELGTAYPVSVKRMERRWQELGL